MVFKSIEDRLSRIKAIVGGWRDTNSISRIERDMVLEELRRIYDAVLDVEEVESADDSSAVESVDAFQAVAPVVDIARDVVDDFDDALDIDALLGLSDDDLSSAPIAEAPTAEESAVEAAAERVVEEAVVEMQHMSEESTECGQESSATVDVLESATEIVKDEVVAAEIQEVVKEEQRVETVQSGGLFDLEDIPVASKSNRRMISLYSDAPKRDVVKVQEPVAPAAVEVAPVAPVVSAAAAQSVDAVEPPKCIGDILAGTVTTLADKMAGDDAPTTAFNRITDLRKAIGLNDKFLMIRDLFGGDAERYEATIDTLDEFDDLDECIIYIVENFRWNPDLEAAKLLVSLIERKLA